MAKSVKEAAVIRSSRELLALRRLKKATDVAYRNFWLNALGINKPPKPPSSEELLSKIGQANDFLMKILPPPRPPFY